MRKIILALAAVAVLAGCSGQQARKSSSPLPTSAVGGPYVPTSPSQPPLVLTMHQARRAYQRIVSPMNRASGLLSADWKDGAGAAAVRGDLHRGAALTRTAIRQFRALRWPAKLRPYLAAALITSLPDQIGCQEAAARAASLTAIQAVFDANRHCTAMRDTGNANTIRSMLGLPPMG